MSSDQPPLVDLVLPVYNEAHVLRGSVHRLVEAMADETDFRWRIVIANNGSTDDTAGVAARLAEEMDEVRLLHLDRKGRGRALRAVWTQSDAEFSIYMDVDLSTDLGAVPAVVKLLRAGADVVTGSRADRASKITRCLRREVLSRGYNRLVRWTLRTRCFDDAQCGFKGVRLATVRPLLPLIENQHWFFDTELLVLAEYADLTVCTLPIRWVEDLDTRVNIPKTIWEDLRGLARLWWTARAKVRRLAPPDATE